jgi:4-amino-4-deoxy-L-arabinose transferase-like glycosyltransferase
MGSARARALGRALALAILAVAAVAWRLSYVRRTLVYPYDSYYYLGTARSLLHHGTYSFRGLPHTRFPPLYPFAIALMGIVAGVERAGRLIPPLAWGGVIVMTYLLGRRLVSRWVGLTAAALLVTQPIGVKWSSVPMGEAVFTLALEGSLFAGLVAATDDRPGLLAVAGLLAGASMLGRYEGVVALPILAALGVVAVRRTSWERVRRPALLGLALLLALPSAWVLRGLLVHAPNQSYASELSSRGLGDVSIVRDRLRYFALEGWLNPWFAGAAWAGLALASIRARLRLAAMVLGSWLVFFVLGHVAWYYVYERFLVPALPAAAILAGILVVTLAEGVGVLLRREGMRPLAAGAVALSLGTAAVGTTMLHDWRYASWLTGAHIADLSDNWGGGVSRDAATALHRELGPGDAVATDSGALVAYYADAPTLYLTFKEGQTVDEPDLTSLGLALVRDLRAHRVRWLVLQVDPGSAPETALAPFGLINGGLQLAHTYFAPSLGLVPHPVEIAVFRLAEGAK